MALDLHRYRGILAVPAFRLFWSTFTLSALGDSVTRFALTWYIWETTHSAQALGLLAFLYTAPVLAGGLIAGWLLDRFGSSRVMAVDNLVRGVAVAAIPALHLLGALQTWHIYALVTVYGFLMMVSLAGGPALIPDLVAKEHLATANAMEMLVYTVSGVLGPPVAGLLIGRLGAPTLVAFDALSYFLFAAALLRISGMSRTAHIDAKRGSNNLLDGFRLLKGNAVLLSTTVMSIPLPPEAMSLLVAESMDLTTSFFASSTVMFFLKPSSRTPRAMGEPEPVEKYSFSSITEPSAPRL